MSESPADQDDPTISNEAELWRRVHPAQVIRDHEGKWRVSSAAFDDPSNGTGMSVYLAEIIIATDRTPASLLQNYQQHGLVSITAGTVRDIGLVIRRSPLPDEPAHAEVCGRKTHSRKKAMAINAIWVIHPSLPS